MSRFVIIILCVALLYTLHVIMQGVQGKIDLTIDSGFGLGVVMVIILLALGCASAWHYETLKFDKKPQITARESDLTSGGTTLSE